MVGFSLFMLMPLAFGEPAQFVHTEDAYEPANVDLEPELAYKGIPITDPNWEPEHTGLGAEPDAQGALNSPTVLFVNFEGPFMNAGCGNDSRNDCSTIFGGVQFNPSPADDATRAAVIQATREDVTDFGVIVVGERPADNNPYAMVVVGTPEGGGPPGVGGVAPGIDCGNNNPNITSFSFLVNASANTQATVIHQEAAHTWGLEHVDDNTDNLFPTAGGTVDPKYQDVCSQVVANTDLDPTGSGCNQIHTMFCEANFQNSYREMLALFGPPILDSTAPTVTIDNPLDGQVLAFDENFDLVITLDDDRRPQVLRTDIIFDGVEVNSTALINTTVSFGINGGPAPSGHGWSNGPHTIRIDIEDESGNPASAEITVMVEGNPDGGGDDGNADGTGDDDDDDDNGGGPGGGDDDDDDDDGSDGTGDGGAMDDDGGDKACACRSSDTPAPLALMVLLGLVVARRRR